MNWISIDDRLPEQGKDVVLIIRHVVPFYGADPKSMPAKLKIGYYCCKKGWIIPELEFQARPPIEHRIYFWAEGIEIPLEGEEDGKTDSGI